MEQGEDLPSQSVRGAGKINLCNRNAFAISTNASSNDTTVTGEEEVEEEE